jgi:thiamine biosynthesis protein ThiS
MSDERIEIFLNGDARQVCRETALTVLLEELGMTVGVLIEYNDRPLQPKEWPGVRLAAGDRVEIIRIVAGG